MKKMLFALMVASVTVSVFSQVNSASAGECVTKTGYYVPYNCQAIGKTATGQTIMICC